MKIVFVSRLYLPHLGGVEIHIKEISAILVRMGHDVTVVASQHEKKLNSVTELDGVKIYRIPFQATEHKFRTWNAVRELKQVFVDADIVHIHDVFWWILPIYKQIKNKVFLTFHGWETKYPIPLNTKIHRFIISKMSKGTVHVGDFIRKFYWDKPSFVTYGGINPKRFTKSNANETREGAKKNLVKTAGIKFVFVGRLEKDNDLELYMNLLNELIAKKVAYEIVWVGEGQLRKKCEKFGEVTGFVKNISQYIVKSDFVFASSYLSILESMCLEKVVLAFYSNQLKKEYLESFPGNKFMLGAGSVGSMLIKLEHLLSSRKLLLETQKTARQFALTQTWNKVVEQYLNLWKPATIKKRTLLQELANKSK